MTLFEPAPFDIHIPPRCHLAQLPTPLRPLDRLRKHIGGPRIWLKSDDLTGSVLSGNKVRKLEYILGEVLRDGIDTLITCGGLQSNHCRATAFAGAQLGLDVRLVLRGQTPDELDGNLLLDHMAGARYTVHPAKDYHQQLDTLLNTEKVEAEKEGRQPRIIPTGASDATGIWGYINAAGELLKDFETAGIQPKTLFCATGSGGTQAGLSLGLHLHSNKTQVVGMAVCDSSDYFTSKVMTDVGNWYRRYAVAPSERACSHLLSSLNVTTNDHYIGPGYAMGYPEMFESIHFLARTEGVLLDPVYTGKAFHGLLQEIRHNRLDPEDDVVFVHTGGSYGVFPYRRQLVKTGV